MKTFKDLKFKHHSLSKSKSSLFKSSKQARETFENGYGVSVLFGSCFYSNGIDTYELAVLFNNDFCYTTDITNDVMGYLTKEEVSDVMIKIQQL